MYVSVCINIYLNVGAINEFLKIFQPNNIMINVAANLKKPVEAMRWQAVRANTGATI